MIVEVPYVLVLVEGRSIFKCSILTDGGACVFCISLVYA